jgi:parvulin-like peptidyl-prolyl isomerase
MRWQRLLRSAAAVVGAAAVGCESTPALHSAEFGVPPAVLVQSAPDPGGARMQKSDGAERTITPTGLRRAAEPAPAGQLVTQIRAVVNGAPIFDDEVREAGLAQRAAIRGLSGDEYKREEKKINVAILEQLIERELLVRDATTKLKKTHQEKVLDKINEEADGQFQRWVAESLKKFKSEDEFKAYLKAMGTSYDGQKRLRERMLLAEEYLRSNILHAVERASGHMECLDYYKTHPEEFMRPDSVEWQDIFIDAAKYPSREAAARAAETVAAQAKAGGDFLRLCQEHDNGLAKTKKGAGIGTRREDVSPPEAAAVLFGLRDGQVGPVVPVREGFHVVRLVKREHAGIAPFDEKLQAAVRDKLRNEVYARESKRFLEDLKAPPTLIERIPYAP